jgi:hypothetical protein
VLAAAALSLALPMIVNADNGSASTTMNFFSGGGGAHADWLSTIDQPPGDSDNQAVRLVTTDQGYAGVLYHHVTGIPAEAFPDSSYWMRGDVPPGTPTLGSPRLVVAFETAAGAPDGDAELDANVFTGDWQVVSDAVGLGVQNGWDIHSAACPFLYHQDWNTAQGCHAGDLVYAVYFTTDPYPREQMLDDIYVNGKRFSSASDNGGGNNDPAGPDATTDPTLLPPILPPL